MMGAQTNAPDFDAVLDRGSDALRQVVPPLPRKPRPAGWRNAWIFRIFRFWRRKPDMATELKRLLTARVPYEATLQQARAWQTAALARLAREERAERRLLGRLKRRYFWRRYGPLILTLVILGLIGLAVWYWWDWLVATVQTLGNLLTFQGTAPATATPAPGGTVPAAPAGSP